MYNQLETLVDAGAVLHLRNFPPDLKLHTTILTWRRHSMRVDVRLLRRIAFLKFPFRFGHNRFISKIVKGFEGSENENKIELFKWSKFFPNLHLVLEKIFEIHHVKSVTVAFLGGYFSEKFARSRVIVPPFCVCDSRFDRTQKTVQPRRASCVAGIVILVQRRRTTNGANCDGPERDLPNIHKLFRKAHNHRSRLPFPISVPNEVRASNDWECHGDQPEQLFWPGTIFIGDVFDS